MLSPPPWANRSRQAAWLGSLLPKHCWAGTLPALSSAGVPSPTRPRRRCRGPCVHTRSRRHVCVLSPALWACFCPCSCPSSQPALGWGGPETPLSTRRSTSANAVHGPKAAPGRKRKHRKKPPAPAGPAGPVLRSGRRQLGGAWGLPGAWLRTRAVSTRLGETGPQEPSAPSPAPHAEMEPWGQRVLLWSGRPPESPGRGWNIREATVDRSACAHWDLHATPPQPETPQPCPGRTGRARQSRRGICACYSLTSTGDFQPPPHALSEPLVSIGRTPHGLI